MNAGKTFRMGRIFRKKKALIVAMDHGVYSGPIRGIENIRDTVMKVVNGGADAVLMNLGSARKCCEELAGKASLILNIPLSPEGVREAVKLGADAIKTTYFGAVPLKENMLDRLYKIAIESEDWGIPYLCEIVPADENGRVICDVEKVKAASRIGAELGADMIKTVYTGSSESFRRVTESCSIPVLVLGGTKLESPIEVLRLVRGSLDGGGAGVVIGRNIWQYDDPEAMTAAISKILHEDAGLDEALKILNK